MHIKKKRYPNEKYGCSYCYDKEQGLCDGTRCKYADILNKYPSYEAYDKEMENLGYAKFWDLILGETK